jgi:hypothetical protein
MLNTRTAIEYRDGAAAVLPSVITHDQLVDEAGRREARLAAEQAIDEVLEESFPASDPPSWNPGIVRPQPIGHVGADGEPTQVAANGARTIDVIDVPRLTRADRMFVLGLVPLLGAAAVGLTFVVGGALKVTAWLLGATSR